MSERQPWANRVTAKKHYKWKWELRWEGGGGGGGGEERQNTTSLHCGTVSQVAGAAVVGKSREEGRHGNHSFQPYEGKKERGNWILHEVVEEQRGS